MKLFPTSPRNKGSNSQKREGKDPPPSVSVGRPARGSTKDVVVTHQEAPGYRATDLFRQSSSASASVSVAASALSAVSPTNRFSLSTSFRREKAGLTVVTSPRSEQRQDESSLRSQGASPTSQGSSRHSTRRAASVGTSRLQVDTTASPRHAAQVANSPPSLPGPPSRAAVSPRSQVAHSPRSQPINSPREQPAVSAHKPLSEAIFPPPAQEQQQQQFSPTQSTSPCSPSKAKQYVGWIGSRTKKVPLLVDDVEKAAVSVAPPIAPPRKTILDGDGTEQVPTYQPPTIPEPESFASMDDDRYATAGPKESFENCPVSPKEIMSSSGVATDSPHAKPIQQQSPLPQQEQQSRSLETFNDEYDDDGTYDDARKGPYPPDAVSQMSSYVSNQASVFAREPVVSAMSNDTSYYDYASTIASYRPKDGSQSEDFRSFAEFESGQFMSSDGGDIYSEDGFILVKQRVAYLSIVLSASQLGIVFIQLFLCGLASLRVNPMIGPYPDAFSEWGGKNTYLLLEEKQYYRVITPVFLHVGILHFIINAYCQLETCAYFEREWGSTRWLMIYLISGVGSVLTASAIDPDLIGVCSSGALMGMFGAKIAQVFLWMIFDLRLHILEQSVQFDQLGGVMCSTAMVSLLSFLTYIDWSGHVGGLVAGFLAGIIFFAKPIVNVCARRLFEVIGFLGLLGGGGYIIRILLFEITPEEELGDACQYFRALYPDGYDCECVW